RIVRARRRSEGAASVARPLGAGAARRRSVHQGLHAMCGIAGFVESSRVGDPLPLDAAAAGARGMGDVIRPPGRDEEGVFAEPGVALGMRRLSIIDLSTGHQPIHNEDRTIWIVFNGEVYNYRDLRRDLEARGHTFYTATDTETIVHAYE